MTILFNPKVNDDKDVLIEAIRLAKQYAQLTYRDICSEVSYELKPNTLRTQLSNKHISLDKLFVVYQATMDLLHCKATTHKSSYATNDTQNISEIILEFVADHLSKDCKMQ